MSLTVNTKTYTADSFGSNAIGYNGPAKTVTTKDDLSLRRTAAKPTANFSGVARSQTKLVKTLTLTGAISSTWDVIANLDVSVPVGAAAADVDTVCDDLASLIGSASFKTHLKTAKINF